MAYQGRSLINMRILFSSLFALTVLFLLPKSIFAMDFLINRDVAYQVTIGSDIEVTELITITNQLTTVYPQKYQLTIKTDKVKDLAVFQDETNQVLKWNQIDSSESKIIDIDLPPIVGKNKSQTLLIVYKLAGSILRQGEVTEINLPELIVADDEPPPKVKLELPPQYDSPAYLSPSATTISKNKDKVIYEFTQGTKHSIKAVFGSFQLYQFTIFYHLNPKEAKNGRYYLTFPPDTPYQRIALSQFSQTPEKITLDPDGNWIAQYPASSANSPIVLTGIAKVFSRPIIPVSTQADKSQYLQNYGYWQLDSQTKVKAKELGSAQKIFEYVVNTLDYDYTKQGTQDSRQGAQKAAANPNYSNCMEFTDLFIAMTRAANIPSRRVIGYANSPNSNLQPVGLQGDILHAWAEYFDANTGIWHPVDPTWSHTSDGLDYFSIWDLQHLTLGINGKSDQLPVPPGYFKVNNQTKNIIVVPVSEFPNITSNLEFKIKPIFYFLPFVKPRMDIIISNTSNISEPRIEIIDDPSDKIGIIFDKNSYYLPPLGTINVKTHLTNNKWLIPKELKIIANDQSHTLIINSNYRYIQISVYTASAILYGITCFLTFKLTRKAWRVPVQKRSR